MSITPRRATVSTLLLAVGLGVGLSGCGVADDQIRPGVAVRVAGEDIGVSEVDETVDGFCAFYDDSESATPVPRVLVRRLVIETFTRREAAERLVDELGVELSSDYGTALSQIEQSYAEVPADQAAAMSSGDTAAVYTALAGEAIGAELLTDETGAEPTDPEESRARGAQAITDWLADHQVEVNPTYGLQIEDGTFSAGDGLSVPASTEAVAAQDIAGIDIESVDQAALGEAIVAATSSLPDDEVCGPRAAG